MAGSEVEICNEAASRVGITDLLEELAEGQTLDNLETPLGEQCALWYPKCRDQLLRWRAFPWPFATRRELLALVADETRSDWSYVYAYPADALAIRYVTPTGVRNPRADQIPPTKIEARRAPQAEGGGVIGKLILCDQKDAEVSFIARVTNPAVFDPDWESALAWRLAAELARSIVKGVDGARLARVASDAYEDAIREAASAALNEQKDGPEPTGEFLASRS